METNKSARLTKPLITQTRNNTTLWIGHLLADPHDHFGGQTFQCPADGTLDNIQIYTSAVSHPGEVFLTLHEFDAAGKTWGPELGRSSVMLNSSHAGCWIRFPLPSVQLHKNHSYGFRLQAPNALIAVGEAASGTQHPFTFGQEWNADSLNEKGHYFTYFSLAFKVEMCA